MPMVFGGPGVSPGLRGQASNLVTLSAGQTYLIPPGDWNIDVGLYACIQQLDSVTGIWQRIGADTSSVRWVHSDGVNWRVANQTGCVVGALITNGGSGYTSPPAWAVSGASAAVISTIIGGAINTSITATAGGTLYTYPPRISIDAPPAGGIQATATCTISAGAVNAITVTNQGAGYATAPNMYFTNDARDTTGSGAAAVTALTGAGTVTGMLVTDHGNPVTAVPTLTPSGGGGSGALATALMCWTITSYTVQTAGSGYVAPVIITGVGGSPTGPAYTNPQTQLALVRKRQASIQAALSGVAITATGQLVDDGGIYDAAPTGMIITSPIVTLTTAAAFTLVMGGRTTEVYLYPA
jgi:hypothetical protein